MSSPFDSNYGQYGQYDLNSEGDLNSQASSNFSLSQNSYQLSDYGNQPDYLNSQDSTLDNYLNDENQPSVNHSFGTCNSTAQFEDIPPTWGASYQNNSSMIDYNQTQHNYSYDAYGTDEFNSSCFTNSMATSSFVDTTFSNTFPTSSAISRPEKNCLYSYSQEPLCGLNNTQQLVMGPEIPSAPFASLSLHSSSQANSGGWQNTTTASPATPASTSNFLITSSVPSEIVAKDENGYLIGENKQRADKVENVNKENEKKLKEKRERNRIAARKCRDKKLNQITEYEHKIGELKSEIKSREQEIANLNKRREELRKMLLDYLHLGRVETKHARTFSH